MLVQNNFAAFLRAFCPAILLALSTLPAQAEYLLRSGDVLGITIIGRESLSRQFTIDTEGRANIPLVGSISAEGLSLSDFREEVVQRFEETTFRGGVANGNEVLWTFSRDTVLIDMVEYRPVYILGDVERPGEVRFRPGMSVFQALAVSGGFRRYSPESDGSMMRAFQLQSRVEALDATIRRQKDTIGRLRTDLEHLVKTASMVASVDPERFNIDNSDGKIDDWATARQQARLMRREATFRTMQQLKEQLEVLKTQEDSAKKSADLDAEQVMRMEQLSNDGFVTAKPLLDARQSLLVATSRALDIGAERGKIQVELSRLALSDRVEEQTEIARVLEMLERQEADLEVNQIERRGVLHRLSQIGLTSPAPKEISPRIFIIRDGTNGTVEIPASGSSILEPGDVLQFWLPSGTDDGGSGELLR